MSVKQPKPAPARPAGKAPNAARRPSSSPQMPEQTIEELHRSINEIKAELEAHAAHLRPLDRKRLNGVGLKIQGFIQRSYEYAMVNPEFLPKYLSAEKLTEDHKRFTEFRTLYDSAKQVLELLWNLLILAADMDYTNNLEFYASVREAAQRRVDGAETIHKDLEVFFRKKKPERDAPTEKELKRDFNALLHNKHDGKIVIENVKPKLIRGKRTVVDEQFKDSVRFSDTEEGETEA